ncbi:hypothetical protein HQN87_24005 [Paenibacillus tritici]|uniref:YNCE-like beta-propeller domain-containing protein n=1 Tax=Paenibacillus tritici TaxID=1873425 RepID=A0ABX2DUM9_9BACL|nr:cytochrome D1 domain-containing protein [Paenibacillus tritici]NQX48398.1 hypothetical protein [Paenibacillus tritici]QUL55673.1 hypothetical protein KDC22_03620 [Paenibacillus tritici]
MNLDSLNSCPCNSFHYQSTLSPVSLPLGSPGDWTYLVTVPFNIIAENQVAKIEVNMEVIWDSIDKANSKLAIEYRLLRNGRQILLDNTIFAYDVDATTVHEETLSFFHVDTPGKGSFTYTLQARISSYNNVEGPLSVSKSDMSVNVFNSVDSSSYLFVTYTSAADGKGYVSVVDPQTQKIAGTIKVGNDPRAIAKSPDGAAIYVINYGDETLSVINAATLQITATISVGTEPVAVVITPDNKQTFVANLGSKSVTVIDNSTHTAVNTIALPAAPFSLTVDTNSWFVIAACKDPDSYAAIDTVKYTVQNGNLAWGSENHNPIAVTNNGNWVPMFGPTNIRVYRIDGQSKFRSLTTWNVGGNIAAVATDAGQWHDIFYAIQAPPSTKIMFAGISTGFAGPNYLDGYKGQNDIDVSSDSQKICIVIEASDDQFAGLQIIEPYNGALSHFVRIPVAHQVVITPDSLQAFVTEEQYVTPVDLVTYTKGEAISIGGKVYGMAVSYRTQSKLRPKTQILESED